MPQRAGIVSNISPVSLIAPDSAYYISVENVSTSKSLYYMERGISTSLVHISSIEKGEDRTNVLESSLMKPESRLVPNVLLSTFLNKVS